MMGTSEQFYMPGEPRDMSNTPPLNSAAMDPNVDPLMAKDDDTTTAPIRTEPIRSELSPQNGDIRVARLNSFVRGEISAVEAYRIAIEKLSAEVDTSVLDVSILRQIQLEHGHTAQALRDRIRELGGTATDSSGFWGTWAKFIMEAAKLFGPAALIKMLIEGEEHGMKDFRTGMEELDGTSAHLIQNQFIPAQQRHIDVLQMVGNARE